MSGRAKSAVLVFAAIAGAVGCAGLIGLGDLERVDGLDASTDPDVVVPIDGPVLVDGGDAGFCVSSGPEVCDDGIDNDCNGRADCADPACSATGFTCVPAIPTGWQPVAFSATQRPNCPAGYATPTDLAVAPASNGTCGCNCNTVGASCAASTFSVGVGVGNCTGATATGLTADGVCNNITLGQVNAGSSIQATVPAGPSACNPNPTNTISGNPPRSGRSCELPRTGRGCTAGVCAKGPGSPFATCIQKVGPPEPCPTGYPNRTLVGTAITDTRSCTTCACAKIDCRARVDIYNNGACNGTADMTALTTGTCTATGNAQFNSNKYIGTLLDGGCRPVAPSVLDGGVALQGQTTICCR